MRVGMVWAQARNGAIGRAGEMPWHIPEDLRHFKKVTQGAPVIMGRNTWESLPSRVRPLPGRTNIVVTRTLGYNAPGAIVTTSVEQALEHARQHRDEAGEVCWVMGGGQIYRAAMPHATELWVTRIELDVPDADTFAPDIDTSWVLNWQSETGVSENGTSFVFEQWVRSTTEAQRVA